MSILTLPLSCRLPNTRHVEGRGALFDALDQAQDARAPLVHLVDAQARHVLATWFHLHRESHAWRSTILHVELEGEALSCHDVCLRLLEIFAHISDDPSLATPSRTLDDALTCMIDFCEVHRLEIVLGQARSASEQARRTLSELIVAHSHVSRWFWLWDRFPGQVSGEILVEGSSSPTPAEQERDVSCDLDEQAWRLLLVLSKDDYTIVERDALVALDIDVAASTLLLSGGLVTRMPSGLALTPRGAAMQAKWEDYTTLSPEALRRELVMALASIQDGERLVRAFDAFSCAITHGLVEEVEAILSAHFEAFRRADLLMDVYVRLLDANESRYRTWLFRASCYMSDFDRAETLRWREELELQDAMYWIYLLLTRGRLAQLHELAARLLDKHERAEQSVQEKMYCEQIRLLRARAFMQSGEHELALQTLEPVITTEDDWMQLNALFVKVRALAYAGEIKMGRELLPGLLQRIEALSFAQQQKWAMFTVQTCYVLKFYEDAARIARRFFGEGASLNHLKSTAPILLSALWVEVGDRQMAERAISLARESFRESPTMFAMTVNIDLADAIARGDVARMSVCLEQFAKLVMSQATETSRVEHHALRRMAWLLFGWAFPDLEPPGFLQESESSNSFVQCFDQLWCITRRDPSRVVCPSARERVEDEESYLFEVLREAWHGALIESSCVDELERAVLVARRLSMHRIGQEIAQLFCVHCFLFEPNRLETAMDKLVEFVDRTKSARFAQELSWWRIIARGQRLEVRQLEALHHELVNSSLASQILAHGLGLRGASEPLARKLAQCMIPEVFAERVVAIQKTAEVRSPGLSLHLDTGEVWVPGSLSGVVLDTAQVGFQLLERLALAQHAPEVSKETLITSVWPEVSEYHPLRHDNRLRVAIKKLRRELRDALSDESPWIQTTTSGYAMACEVRLVQRRD